MIGSDTALRGTMRPTLRPQRPGPQQQTPSYGSRPPGISDAAVTSVVNNQLEGGYGVGRATLGQQDRAGVSRGRGQQYYANVAQDAANVQAAAQATNTMSEASSADASAWEHENAMRNEQLSNQGLLEGLRNAQSLANLSRQQQQQQLYEAIRNGQFGLDQQQLDYTPLLNNLFT